MNDQKTFNFGTEAHKLHRKDSLGTSIESAYSVDTTRLEEMVYNEIASFGNAGCISDDILYKYPSFPYSSITARFASLERKGLIYRNGEKKRGRSGRNQSVMRVVE
jgi:hypothetical protein